MSPFRHTISGMRCKPRLGTNVSSMVAPLNPPQRPVNPTRIFSSQALRRLDLEHVHNVPVVHDLLALTSLPETPNRLARFHDLPARSNWFHVDEGGSSFRESFVAGHRRDVSYELVSTSTGSSQNWQTFRNWVRSTMTYETMLGPYLDRVQRDMESGFVSFEAPISLMARASEFNRTRASPQERVSQLYIAQSSIESLPRKLRADLPTPEFIRMFGRGDVYGSSIWIGLQPTYTPLHRDPNPNIFCQILGSKVVRMMPPELGEALYNRVRRKLNQSGNSRFRGTEMMHGPERAVLHQAVWISPEKLSDRVQQTILEAGDALFIPKGWWHSVASVGDDAELNASANWWFR